MKILFIYPNSQGYGRIPLGLSLLMTISSSRGHRVTLFDTTFMMHADNVEKKAREEAGMVKRTDASHLYDDLPLDAVDAMLRKKIKSFHPDLVAVSTLEDSYALADHFMKVVKSCDDGIPVVIGGSAPTVAPHVIIQNPCVDYLIQGEGEEAFPELCELLEGGRSVEGVRNLWYKKNGTVHNNPLRPLVSMDTLPAQDLRLWDPRHFVRPYDGKIYRAGFFETSRGCPNRCSYCINITCQRIFRGAGSYFRKKSIIGIMQEIRKLQKRYHFEMIIFSDDNFLLSMSPERMKEFSRAWNAEIRLPYWFNTEPRSITREKMRLVKESGCCGIGIGVESGSTWMLKNILWRKEGVEDFVRAFAIIHEFGIRSTANFMIGFPGEHERDIFETIKLAKRIRPDSFTVSFVAPYYGTPIYFVTRKLDYIKTLKRPGFNGMPVRVALREPTIRLPLIDRKKLKMIFYNFSDYLEGRAAIPKQFDDALSRGRTTMEAPDTMSEDVAAAMALCRDSDLSAVLSERGEPA